MRALFIAFLIASSASAEVCGRNDLYGAYGFQLSGANTISGEEKRSAAIGRLEFASDGAISGTASVNFNGLFLGNPVTGKYTFDEKTCALTFELQDTSGAYQHFRGTARPGGAAANFTQSDPGTGGRGILRKLADVCAASAFHGEYAVTVNSRQTVTIADGKGGLAWTAEGAVNSGTYTVDADCFMEIDFGVKLRGVLADGGRTVLAVQSDPGNVSTATFTAR